MRRLRLFGLLGWMILATIGTLAGETPASHPPTAAEERARHRRIWEAVDEGRFDDAMKLANEAVAARADDVEAHFALAHARMQRESRVDGLLRDLRARLQSDPKNPVWPVVLVRLGAESRFWEDEPEFSRLADRAVALAPDWGWARFAYGTALQFYGQRNDAADEGFRRACERDPGNPVFVLAYGRRLERHGWFDQSEKLYADLVKIDPEEAVARRQIWRARVMRRPVAQFRAELDQEIAAALAEFPKSAPLRREAAYFYDFFLHDTARAEQLNTEAARLSPNAGHRYGYTLFSRVTRVGTVRTVCVTGPPFQDARRYAAIVTGPPAERFDGLLAFIRPLKLTEATVDYFEGFFNVCVEARKPVDAEAAADRLTAFDPVYLPIYGEVARLYLNTGADSGRSLRLAQRAAAAKLPPVAAPVKASRMVEASEINLVRDQLFAKNADTLAWALIATGKEAEALAPLRASISRFPTGDALFRLGQILERRGDTRGALQAYADSAVCAFLPPREARPALAALVKSSGIAASVETELSAAVARRLEREQRGLRAQLVDRPAPEFSVLSPDGDRRLTSADLRGKVTVISFWETGRPRSEGQMPFLASLYRRFSPNPGFAFVSLNPESDTPATRRFLKTANLPFPVYEGLLAGQDFEISTYPTCLVLDRRGHIRYVGDEFDPMTGTNDLEAVVRMLLAEPKTQVADQSRRARRSARNK